MQLIDQQFIVIDFQTSGTRADEAYIIEAGWGLYQASEDPAAAHLETRLLALPDGFTLSRQIQKLTGLSAESAGAEGQDYLAVAQELATFLAAHPELPLLVHFARFKLAFLERIRSDLGLQSEDWPGRTLCTFKLAKALLPQLKSHSLRAAAGYCGYSLQAEKRSRDHMLATTWLWQALQRELRARDLDPVWKQLQDYRGSGEAAAALYPDALRTKRLALPAAPGIYLFKDRSGRVLYVGKALDLKQRVNSYFRGRKTKGQRLNEMLARASDFDFEVCRYELEALLRESDTIKARRPPYNRLLLDQDRSVSWKSLQGDLASRLPRRAWGPFTSAWNWHFLGSLFNFDATATSETSRWLEGLEQSVLEQGLEIFKLKFTMVDREPYEIIYDIWQQEKIRRQAQALASEPDMAEGDESEDEADEEQPLTAEDLAVWIEKSIAHICYAVYRGRWLLRLVDGMIHWENRREAQSQSFTLTLQGGTYVFAEVGVKMDLPKGRSYEARRQSLDLATYDRLSIVYRELKRGLKRGDTIRIVLASGLILEREQLTSLLL